MDVSRDWKLPKAAKIVEYWGRVDFLKGNFYEQKDWRLDKFTHTSRRFPYYAHDVSSSAW